MFFFSGKSCITCYNLRDLNYGSNSKVWRFLFASAKSSRIYVTGSSKGAPFQDKCEISLNDDNVEQSEKVTSKFLYLKNKLQ